MIPEGTNSYYYDNVDSNGRAIVKDAFPFDSRYDRLRPATPGQIARMGLEGSKVRHNPTFAELVASAKSNLITNTN